MCHAKFVKGGVVRDPFKINHTSASKRIEYRLLGASCLKYFLVKCEKNVPGLQNVQSERNFYRQYGKVKTRLHAFKIVDFIE